MNLMKALWRNIVLAESRETIMLGKECYFPPETVRMQYLVKNAHVRYCHAKGNGECFDMIDGEHRLVDGAWVYPHPFWEAEDVRGMISFGEGVELVNKEVIS